MPLAIRAITRIQDGDDTNFTLGAGQDGYSVTWDNGTSKFVMTDVSGSAAAGGSDTQVQFNNSTALDGHANFTWDTTNNNKLTVNGQSIYVPGGDFTGTMFVGDGGGSLAYTAGNDGRYNTAIGIGAMAAAVSTSYSLAEGYRAGYSSVSGSNWIAQGYAAGYLNTSGNSWVAQGYQAGYSNATGSSFIAQGYQAGYSNTAGSYWFAQGHRAGYSSTSGGSWSAQGYQAGYSNTVGNSWIAQGVYAGYANVSGSNWLAQGYAAGYLNASGINWIAQGVYAGYSNVSGSYWQAHGYKALYNALGHGDIGIGFQAGDNISTGEYNIVIGYDKDAPSATADYQLVIGDYIEGNGTDLALRPRADATDAIQLQNAAGTTTVLQVDTTNDRVGIGGDPSTRIHVTEEDAVTAAITDVAVWGHNSTGTPAAGFGGATLFELESSTTADTEAGRITYEWATATHATRKALAKWTVYDTAEREGLAIEASGTAPMIGFLGTAAVAQQAGTGETTGFTAGSGTAVNDDSTFTGNVGATAYRISDVVKALKNYGLLAQ